MQKLLMSYNPYWSFTPRQKKKKTSQFQMLIQLIVNTHMTQLITSLMIINFVQLLQKDVIHCQIAVIASNCTTAMFIKGQQIHYHDIFNRTRHESNSSYSLFNHILFVIRVDLIL